MSIKRIFAFVLHHPFRHDGAAARDDSHLALHSHRNMLSKKPRVKSHEIDSLLRLGTDDFYKKFGIHLRYITFKARNRLVNGDSSQGTIAFLQHSLTNRF